MGYLERNEPLLDQPDRKATSFVTSHFYLDDFVQFSEDPNPRPLQHTPLQAISKEGFRTPAEATDKDVRLARRYQGYGGTRFVKDDLAGDPRPARWPATGRGRPPYALRSTADGAAAADLIGAGACSRAGLPLSAAPGRRRVRAPERAAPSGPAQPPPQIIGRLSNVERAGGGARRGGNRGDGGRGSGGGRGGRCRRGRGRSLWVPGGPGRRGRCPAPTADEVAGTLAGAAGVGAAATAGLAVGIAGGAAYGLARGTRLGAGEHALPAPAGQRGRGRAGRPVRQQHE